MTDLTTKLFAVEMISQSGEVENRTLLSTNYTREGAESVIKKLTDKIRIARPESAFEVVEFERAWPIEKSSLTLKEMIADLRKMADMYEEQIKAHVLSAEQTMGLHKQFNWRHRVIIQIKPATPCNENEAAEFIGPDDKLFSDLTDDEFTARLTAFLGEGATVPLFRKDGRIERAKTLALPCFANLLKEPVQ